MDRTEEFKRVWVEIYAAAIGRGATEETAENEADDAVKRYERRFPR